MYVVYVRSCDVCMTGIEEVRLSDGKNVISNLQESN